MEIERELKEEARAVPEIYHSIARVAQLKGCVKSEPLAVVTALQTLLYCVNNRLTLLATYKRLLSKVSYDLTVSLFNPRGEYLTVLNRARIEIEEESRGNSND